uniref:Uncharacterized protein n=1 Tax=Caulerpa ashmeadii TaxID=177078 RepID=A0A6B9VXE9_9CHLO|nr:hypothetical protein [Caulerpa ashmeadii]QHQ73325.1 hypothetical protein [Caulerpa ashmeadii]
MEISNNFIKHILKEKGKINLPRTQNLSPEKGEQILEEIAKKFELTEHPKLSALTILAVLFQQGATARSCNGNMNITIFGKDIKLAEIRKIFREHNASRGERKFARTYADQIYTIALELEIKGNLANKIMKINPTLNLELAEQVWLSDFQVSNPNAPKNLRELILSTFEKKKKEKEKYW